MPQTQPNVPRNGKVTAPTQARKATRDADARMILWPKQWGSPWNRTAGMCHDVLADDLSWCERVGPTRPPLGSSSFEDAMHGAGVLVLAADSRVIWPTLHQTFGDLLNATRWTPWDDSASPPMLSLSYTSARVPNAFCAQPTFDALGCGAHDVLLLFRSSPKLLKLACSISLHDACGRNLCRRERRAQVLSQFQRGANPRSTLRSRTRRTCPGRHELERAAALCDLQGGSEEGAGRCTTTGAAGLEEAMLAFQAACRVPAVPATAPATPSGAAAGPVRSNTSFEESPTCWGRNRGALHNELQFMAPTTHESGRLLAMALIGVGVIIVASHPGSSSSSGGGGGVGSWLANASAVRRCRARRLAAALYERFVLTPSAAQRSTSHSPSSHSPSSHLSAWSRPQPRRLEVWGFEMRPSLTPKAPLLYNAHAFCSRAHSCVGGGCHKISDFAVEETGHNEARLGRRGASSGAIRRILRRAPPLPRASSWGYSYAGNAWQLWTRLE